MFTLTIKNLSPALHRQLKHRAKSHHRSLNKEVIACLSEHLKEEQYPAGKAPAQDVKVSIEDIRHSRESLSVYVTDADLDRAINEGHP